MIKDLQKKWVYLLLISTFLLGSCVDNDYDLDNYQGEYILRGLTLVAPVGTINHTIEDVSGLQKFDYELECEGDTVFMIYSCDLELLSGSGENITSKNISVFKDIEPSGSVLFFSNPIFNCTVENKDDAEVTLHINHFTGRRDNVSFSAKFNGTTEYDIFVPAKTTVRDRFDRVNGETHQIFRIATETGVGPFVMDYNVSHNAPTNNSLSANITAKLPFSFDAGSKYLYKDTLDVDMSEYEDYDLEQVVVRFYYDAKMPAGGKTDVFFCDENFEKIPQFKPHSLNLKSSDLEGIVLKGTNGHPSNVAKSAIKDIMFVVFDSDELKAVKSIKNMIININVGNPEKNVHFKPDDFIHMKVDFYAKGSIKF
jgi:hypothetical protein